MDVPSEIYLIITIFVLIVISAFFSGSETALTALSRAKIHKLVQKGYKKAIYVSKLRKNKERLIGSILIGNNLVNILASALATKLFLDIFGNNGVAIATITMTIIVVIFAEVLPKTYALYNAEKVSLTVSTLLRVLIQILTPLTIIVQFFTNIFLKPILNHRKDNKNDLITAIEELRGTIELHYKEGGVLKQDKDMLDSILELSATEVSSIMTHRKSMFTVNYADENTKILEMIAKSSYTRIPLWQNHKDNIIGVLHVKDVLKTTLYSTKEVSKINFSKIASKPWFIPENTTLREQLFAFKKERNHFAVVVDEYGSVMGIVTLEDILEEIVGEIKDEHDKGSIQYYKKISDNTYIIEGNATVRDINRDLDLSLPENNASTLAGLLIDLCKKIPDRGEKFEFYGFKFKVVEKHKNQITKLKLSKPESQEK